jgi:uncharacterized RDD family membrane protein YckC
MITKPGPPIEYEEANNYRRLAARLIDLGIAFFILICPASLLASGVGTLLSEKERASTLTGLLFFSFIVLLLIAYDTILHRVFGKTVGKWILGMRVVDINGEKLGWGRSLIRAVALYGCGVLFAAGIVISATILGWVFIFGLPKYRRFLHDTMCKCYVVKESQGQLVKAVPGARPLVGPLADLERIHSQGLISEEEYERKKKELTK